jgi:acetolactate synthase regulatory subunit
MQKELDPNIGRKEIEMMKNEIHNMELRFQQMKRKQEELIKDIERCVAKRETIQWKYLPMAEKQAKGTKVSASKMARDLQTLKTTLKHTTDNAAQVSKSIEEKGNDVKKSNDECQIAADNLKILEQNISKRQIELLSMQIDKQVGLSKILELQSKAKLFDAFAKGSFKEKSIKEKDTSEDLYKAIDAFKTDHPQFIPVIDKIIV